MEGSCEIPRWQQLKKQLRNLDPDAFKSAMAEEPDQVILDVRTEEEVAEGTLAGAINIDYLGDQLLDQLDQLDRDETYFIICRTGRRSVRTGILMRNWGFPKVVNLDGGLTAWVKEFGTLER